MSKRFIIVPEGTFTDTSDWEAVSLVPDELPETIYLDFNPALLSTLTKDGSDRVSEWRNSLGAQALNTPGVGGNFPLWLAAQVNGLPAIEANNGGNFMLYSAADILHNLSVGYAWAAVVSFSTSSLVVWSTSVASAICTSEFITSGNQTVRNSGSESLIVSTGTTGGPWYRIVGSYNPTGNALNYWENGVKKGGYTSAGLPSVHRKMSLGWNSTIVGRLKYARFLFFNASLSDSQAETVDRMLETEYAL